MLTLVVICSSTQDLPTSRTASNPKLISAGPIQLTRTEVAVNMHSDQYPGLYTSKDGQPEVYDNPPGPVINGDVESSKEI
jgi:hypothetical protein